jgi:hypothetical protein
MLNENIDAITACAWYWFRTLVGNAARGQFLAEALFVGGFKEPRPEDAVNFDGLRVRSMSGPGFIKRKITTELAEEAEATENSLQNGGSLVIDRGRIEAQRAQRKS